jgi:hypothetical protein
VIMGRGGCRDAGITEGLMRYPDDVMAEMDGWVEWSGWVGMNKGL